MARGAPIDQQSVTVQGSDDEGWISMVIDLGALSNGSASYNRILFKDISGAALRHLRHAPLTASQAHVQ